MKSLRKIVSIMLVVCMLATVSVISAFAYKAEVKDTGSGNLIGVVNDVQTSYTSNVSYAGDWLHTITVDNGRGKLKYGFDTYKLNEDIASTYNSTYAHQAVVKNNNGEASYSADPGEWTATVFLEHSAKPTWALYR